MTPFPLVIVTLPIVVAALVYAVRHLEVIAALVAATVAVFLATAIAFWPPVGEAALPGISISLGAPWVALGQSFVLDAAARPALIFVFGVAAVVFVAAAIFPQNRSFASGGLLVLSGFAAALLVHPLFMAPVILAATAAVAVFPAQGGRAGPTRGALRQMLFPYLAFPFFLLAAWYMEQAPFNPDDPTPLQTAGRLFSWGFFFLLGAAPLHGAMPALLAESPPLAGVLLVLGNNAMVFTLSVRFPEAYPWLTRQVNAEMWLLGLGTLTALWGGVAALGQRDFGRLWGYAAVHDYGALLLGLSMEGPLGVSTMLTMMLARSLSLIVGASALSTLRARMGSDAFARVRGAATRLPWATAGLMVAGLGLVGWPLTASFGARWALLRLLMEGQQVAVAGVFALSAAGVVLGYVRGAAALMGRIPREQIEVNPVEREPARAAAWMMVLIVIVVVVALAPQVTAPWITAALDALTGSAG